MNLEQAQRLIETRWQESIIPQLQDYIRIPNKSPLFDPEWQQHGHMDKAVSQIADWCKAEQIEGMTLEILISADRTPLIFMDIPGQGDGNVLLYGHLDKQPEMHGWREPLGPWQPVIEGDKLYGRGGADDGYAVFASLTAVRILKQQNLPHANLKIIIEASEESGSPDLLHYIDQLAGRIGDPDLIICLDSGCGNYEQLWCTTSLRGMVSGTLQVEVLNEGVHSGDAGGIVPSSFRIIRSLLSRLEDESTGQIFADAFNADIPAERVEQAGFAASILGNQIYQRFPFAGNTSPQTSDLGKIILDRTWRPSLAVTGASGLPDLNDAGNVLRPATALKLSLRLPPVCDAEIASQAMYDLLTADPPQNASVSFDADLHANGWNAPVRQSWLSESINKASKSYFSKSAAYMGEGGTIPFIPILAERFPDSQFLITGVLGPLANAHGPNEFLHLPTAKKLTGCIASVIADHYTQSGVD